ncbi:MAG: hypothetical protein J6Y02_21655 [Pseudobutyrivibrio sp.]|nr:hypothetical protein [Pseudobutyrivibrio sp.]
MKKEKETKNRTEHFYNARRRLVLAGAVTLAVPLTGLGSLLAVKGIKELVKEYKVQKELEVQYAESDKTCEELLNKAKEETQEAPETEEITSEENNNG